MNHPSEPKKTTKVTMPAVSSNTFTFMSCYGSSLRPKEQKTEVDVQLLLRAWAESSSLESASSSSTVASSNVSQSTDASPSRRRARSYTFVSEEHLLDQMASEQREEENLTSCVQA